MRSATMVFACNQVPHWYSIELVIQVFLFCVVTFGLLGLISVSIFRQIGKQKWK